MTKLYKKRIFEIADEIIELAKKDSGYLRYSGSDIPHLEFLFEHQILGIEMAKGVFGSKSETPAERVYHDLLGRIKVNVTTAGRNDVLVINSSEAEIMSVGLVFFSGVGKYTSAALKHQ
jgi:hypothetical protein